MDIARPDISRKKRRKRILLAAAGLAVLALVTVALSQLDPAAPTVDKATVWVDTVKRGPMLRQVRGTGSLVPKEIRWIAASSPGRIERMPLLPGVTVTADTILLELSNPELVQSAFDAESAVGASEAQLEALKVQLESEHLSLESVITTLRSQCSLAEIEAEIDEKLRREGLLADINARRSRTKADELSAQLQLEVKRMEIAEKSAHAQLLAAETELANLRKQLLLKQQLVAALKVRAGCNGVLQRLGDERSLQIGQQLDAGANIAQVADPTSLKAEVRVAETQARDIQYGQTAVVDTRNGMIPGRVVRIDPAVQNGTVTVDIALDGPLPKGARPDLSVDATITLERLDDVLFVGRPVNGQADSTVSLFKLTSGGDSALRVPVQLGRASVSSIEVVQGLKDGDQVVLSDMSQWDNCDRIALK